MKKDNEYSSSLAVFTSPPEVFHGNGQTVEASREEAAMKALNAMHECEESGTPTTNE